MTLQGFVLGGMIPSHSLLPPSISPAVPHVCLPRCQDRDLEQEALTPPPCDGECDTHPLGTGSPGRPARSPAARGGGAEVQRPARRSVLSAERFLPRGGVALQIYAPSTHSGGAITCAKCTAALELGGFEQHPVFERVRSVVMQRKTHF